MEIPHRDDVTKTPYIDLIGGHGILVFSLVWTAKTAKLEISRIAHAAIRHRQRHFFNQGAPRMAYTTTKAGTPNSDSEKMK